MVKISETSMQKHIPAVIVILALIGVADAGFLTYEHYRNAIPPCITGSVFFTDCGTVLKSSYATIFGIPISLIGFFHYSLLTAVSVIAYVSKNQRAKLMVVILTGIGFLTSLYLVFLQLFIIQALCLFCMLSALVSLLLFILAQITYTKERKQLAIMFFSFFYRYFLKPRFFRIDPEMMHNAMTSFGQRLGTLGIAKALTAYALRYEDKALEQTIAGIPFRNPIGLSAGFDYEARLTQILPATGFGFQTVGTITNLSYEGNPRPMLGRLPKSQSLMVNKGFKNLGARQTAEDMEGLHFRIPVGVSIGRTNAKKPMSQKESVADILKAFSVFEQSSVHHAYYELNISCPNLYGNVTFYPPKNLSDLLKEVDNLRLSRPLFIKMPIEKSGEDVLSMLSVIAKHQTTGVIFGNLQKNRNHPALVPEEVKQFPVGNFSGKPTWEQSNELIRLTYKYYKKRFVIIGCGGVFSTEDAYTKITLGASLVQLITGMIFQGPQLIGAINIGLVDLLKKDGFTHIRDAIGSRNS
ncbi:MAG: quinone-dependent dihydroorotate dehydrogenase [Candidatus Levybacteria bacterium]|nr:quinone-dependent dihydroorotate dehydrogenase [Candidatus Levybacteria bacterium]